MVEIFLDLQSCGNASIFHSLTVLNVYTAFPATKKSLVLYNFFL
jgi:hypothetical protein